VGEQREVGAVAICGLKQPVDPAGRAFGSENRRGAVTFGANDALLVACRRQPDVEEVGKVDLSSRCRRTGSERLA
jgi:hypothetical protein